MIYLWPSKVVKSQGNVVSGSSPLSETIKFVDHTSSMKVAGLWSSLSIGFCRAVKGV